jgi:diaminopimelate epimerase
MTIKFEKYHGLGNDYLVYDLVTNKYELNEKQISLLCNRNFGFGSDGILFGPIYDKDNRLSVKIFNPDGKEAEKSGNGIRIFSKFLKDFGYVKTNKFNLLTLGGEVNVEFINNEGTLIKVFMGKTTFLSKEIPVDGENREVINERMTFNEVEYSVTCVSIGNPHCVIPIQNITKQKAIDLGPFVENSHHFPNKINMQLLEVIDRNNIKIEIYERGAGYTLASGSSSCAAASVAYKLGMVDDNVVVHMPGGNLEIEISQDSYVHMTGSVNRIGTFIVSDDFFEEIKKFT